MARAVSDPGASIPVFRFGSGLEQAAANSGSERAAAQSRREKFMRRQSTKTRVAQVDRVADVLRLGINRRFGAPAANEDSARPDRNTH